MVRLDLILHMEGVPLAVEQAEICRRLQEEVADTAEIKVKAPPPLAAAAIDPATAAFVLGILGSAGVVALVNGVTKVVIEHVRLRNAPIKVRIGKAEFTVPQDADMECVERLADVVAKAVQQAQASKAGKKTSGKPDKK